MKEILDNMNTLDGFITSEEMTIGINEAESLNLGPINTQPYSPPNDPTKDIQW